MKLPAPRGPISERVVWALRTGAAPDAACALPKEVLTDDDAQLATWTMYELHYRGFEDVPGDREWDPDVVRLRGRLEERMEQELRAATAAATAAGARTGDVAQDLLTLVAGGQGPCVASFLQRHASREHVLDFLRQRSIYHLKESDPHSFVLPRIDGAPKVALAELQYDEYGAGHPARLHATMFAEALRACGLEPTYGAYVHEASPQTLAVNNVQSLFGLRRRLRGAAMGHLAAFEATSSLPCRRIAAGIARVGLPQTASAYFDEHVEADAVHEHVAVVDICGGLVAAEPQLYGDVLFGAAACLHLDALAGSALLQRWDAPAVRGVGRAP